MSDSTQPAAHDVAQKFLDALIANDAEAYEPILAEDVGLRLWRWDGGEAYRPRERVIRRLMQESSAWRDVTMQTCSLLADRERAAVEFRIQATENQRYVEHNRSAFLTLNDGRVQVIDLYCAQPLPSSRRKGWIAPASLSQDELNRFFESLQYSFDVREWLPPSTRGRQSSQVLSWGSDLAHPGMNGVAGARWTAEEADAKIEELIAFHRERNIGFQWFVGPFDTPADLPERLERHGLVLAGDHAVMARTGLDELDIPINPAVQVQLVDGSDVGLFEEMLNVAAVGFHMPPEQVDEFRKGWLDRMQNPKFREEEFSYVARLDGKSVAYGRLMLHAGRAHLGGAATLPEYRGQRVYSTLLRRRLEDARARGYEIATIDSAPMSRPVVTRYGFREFAKTYIYAWMPVIDMQVIKTLVPHE